MKKLVFLLAMASASWCWAVSADIQCTDNESGGSISFDFRSGNANIYVCDSDAAPCDSKNVQPEEQAVITSNLPGQYDPITYKVTAGSSPLAHGSKFIVKFNEDNSVQISPEGDDSRFSCN